MEINGSGDGDEEEDEQEAKARDRAEVPLRVERRDARQDERDRKKRVTRAEATTATCGVLLTVCASARAS